MAKWVANPGDGFVRCTNYVLEGKDFWISYNPGKEESIISKLYGFGSDHGGPETALITKEPNYSCLVLNGDFRADYEKLLDQGYEACRNFYEHTKLKYGSHWSSDNKKLQ